MTSAPKCYIINCGLQPVFRCSCQENVFSCQKHCFSHMQETCSGKLEPFIYMDPGKIQQPKPQPKAFETSKRLEPLPQCDLLANLFPGEVSIFQCTHCGKLVPKSSSSCHVCERDELSILSINYQRQSYNRYLCMKCSQVVHSSFLYPHADLHNEPEYHKVSKEEISYICSLLIKNTTKSEGKEVVQKIQSKGKMKNEPSGNTEMTMAEAKSLPVKRPNSGVMQVDSDSD